MSTIADITVISLNFACTAVYIARHDWAGALSSFTLAVSWIVIYKLEKEVDELRKMP